MKKKKKRIKRLTDRLIACSRHRRRFKLRPPTKREIAVRVREMTRARYSVVCFYQGGLNTALDRQLRKLARQSGDSGMFLWSGIRDLEFYYPSAAVARRTAKRIKAATKREVITMLRCFEKA